jgi:hypothetical protein
MIPCERERSLRENATQQGDQLISIYRRIIGALQGTVKISTKSRADQYKYMPS